MTRNDDRVIFDEKHIKGDSMYHNDALSHIIAQDSDGVINSYAEKKQLFDALRMHRDHGVTVKELKGILASFKYGTGSQFSRREVNVLAQELGVGKIEKKHLPSRNFSHDSHLDRARHVVYYTNNDRRDHVRSAVQSRVVPSDDVVHYEINTFLKDKLHTLRKRDVISGEMMFMKEDEESLSVDPTGKRIFMQSSRVTRPDMPVKSQASFRARGIVKNMPKDL